MLRDRFVRPGAERGVGHRTFLRRLGRAGGNEQPADRFLVLAAGAGVANAHRVAVALLHRVSDHAAAQGHLDLGLHILDGDAVTGRPVAVDGHVEVALAHDRGGDHVACPADRLDRLLDLPANAVDGVEVRTEDLDADIGPDAGREHLDAVDDWLSEDVAPAGHLEDAAHLVIDQVALRPAGTRPEQNALAERLLQLFA